MPRIRDDTRPVLLFHAAALSSLSAPRITILSASSGNGRCKAFASSHGARIQTSRSSSVVRITGIAFGWIGFTTAFACVVRKPYTSCGPGIGFDFVPRSPLNVVQMPAKANSGRSSLSANHTTFFFLVSGFGSGAYSAKLLAGTKQRFSGLSHMRQCGEDVLRMLVTGGPAVRGGGGMPPRTLVTAPL